MALTFAENNRPPCHNCWSLAFPVALLFAVWLTGCNNACFTFTSNPPTGTIGINASDPSPTCTLAKANGTVRLTVLTVPMCGSCSDAGRIRHIFLSIRDIGVHPSPIADDDSPDWQELLSPGLVKQPRQVDLVRGTADRSAREPLREIVTIPAGIYRRLRLRFVPNQPATDGRLPENPCGSGRFNCIVMADGHIEPLQLDGGSSHLRITSDRIEGASLLIPPDTDIDLVIELKLVWEWFSSADEGMRFLPTLAGAAKLGRMESDELGTAED
jgi:Domain of unknown function (DUF4382)